MKNEMINDELMYLRKRARRRLVGAIALVLFALTVLWTALDNTPPQFAQKQTIEIISSAPALWVERASVVAVVQVNNDAEFKNPPVDAAPTPQNIAQPTVAPVITSPDILPGTLVNNQLEVEQKKSPPTVKPSQPPVRTVTPLPKRADPLKILQGQDAGQANETFYFQVGAFADHARALQLLKKLKQAGLPAKSEKITTSQGVLTRIRVGPSNTEARANEWRKKSESLGISGKVVRS